MSEEPAQEPEEVPRTPGKTIVQQPMTRREAVTRAKELFATKSRGSQREHDRWALFAEWIRSDAAKFMNVRQWVKAMHPEIHPYTFAQAEWGGFSFWNMARDSFRREALARVIEKSPNSIAKRIEKGLEAATALHDTVIRMSKRINARLDADKDNDKTLEANAIRLLAEAVTSLNESLRTISGGQPAAQQTNLNMFQIVMQQIQDRDKKFGVQD